MSVSMLLPVLFGSGGVSEVVFVDFSTMEVYRANGETVSPEQSREIVSEMMSQQEASTPKIPHDQIRRAMKAENDLIMENAEHVYKRSF